MLYQVTMHPTSPWLLLCKEQKFSEKFPQTGIKLNSMNHYFVSHISTYTERAHLIPWTLSVIWGQEIQVLGYQGFQNILLCTSVMLKFLDLKERCLHLVQAVQIKFSLWPSSSHTSAHCSQFWGGLHPSHSNG